MSCFKHMQQQQQMWPWDELFETLPPSGIRQQQKQHDISLCIRGGGDALCAPSLQNTLSPSLCASCLQSTPSPSPSLSPLLLAPCFCFPCFAGWRAPKAGRRGVSYRKRNKRGCECWGCLEAS